MKKKITRKGASKSNTKSPLFALSKVVEKELTLDTRTLEKLDAYLLKNGGEDSGLTRSDLVAHLLLEKGQSGFKFSIDKNEDMTEKLVLPQAAWNIAEKSAAKSGDVDLSDVVKNLASEL